MAQAVKQGGSASCWIRGAHTWPPIGVAAVVPSIWLHLRTPWPKQPLVTLPSSCPVSGPPGRMVEPYLPRWIATRRCDSGAMLAAFLWYRQHCTTAEANAVGYLYSIEHAEQGFVMIDGQKVVPQRIPSPVPTMPCTAASCARCEGLRGGYQFRWYSPKWEEAYLRGARPGAWHPGEPEEDTANSVRGVAQPGLDAAHPPGAWGNVRR